MNVLFTETAAAQLENQIDHIASKGAPDAARRIKERVGSFIYGFLTAYPRAARFVEEKSIYEAAIPGTNYVVFYRLEGPDTLRVLALFHGAQDRSDFSAGGD